MSIMNETQSAPPGATPIPPSGGTGAPSPKVDIGGVCVETPTSNPPQTPKEMVSPYADTMLYGILSPEHPKPENPSLFPWDNLHTDFMAMATRYAAEMQEARKIADQWWYACLAARKERDALKAQVAELEQKLDQLRGDGFAVS